MKNGKKRIILKCAVTFILIIAILDAIMLANHDRRARVMSFLKDAFTQTQPTHE